MRIERKDTPRPLLPIMIMDSNFISIPMNAGWTEVVTGSGASNQRPFASQVWTGATVSSSTLRRETVFGFVNAAAASSYFNWDKELYFIFSYARSLSDTEAIGRVQIKEVTTIGALGAKGIGLRADNLDLVGESYGTEIGEVTLSVTLVTNREQLIAIRLVPSVPKIEWWVNGVLKGTQSTAAKIPSGLSSTDATMMHSINKSAATTTGNAQATMENPRMWQAR